MVQLNAAARVGMPANRRQYCRAARTASINAQQKAAKKI
jgi:hypothetical protein